MQDESKRWWAFVGLFGLLAVIWMSVLIAPCIGGGLPVMIPKLAEAFSHPLRLSWCDTTFPCVLIFSAVYGLVLLICHYTKPNYRRREEHGSASWGSVRELYGKYHQEPYENNKILTQNVSIGYNMREHRRNMNTLIVGGSGSGKTYHYAKPNAIQANTSMVVLDPKGEILRDTGKLFKAKGYDVKVLDLINMDKSHCYNLFVYLENDNDVQRLVTNLFKSTTPKGSQSNDPFWDTAASMLLLSLIFYLKYEAPPEEQNFPMVMEMLRAADVDEESEKHPQCS